MRGLGVGVGAREGIGALGAMVGRYFAGQSRPSSHPLEYHADPRHHGPICHSKGVATLCVEGDQKWKLAQQAMAGRPHFAPIIYKLNVHAILSVGPWFCVGIFVVSYRRC